MEKLAKVERDKKEIEILADIWEKKSNKSMKCPKCGGNLVLVQVEPVSDAENAYVPYDTVVECTFCPFSIHAESFTILGSVREFDEENVELSSWSPSGSRVISRYEHALSFDTLTKLKKSGELVEFLVVNKQVIQIIG